MRKKILIQWGLASLLVGGAFGGLTAAGCGSSSDNGATGNGSDGGPDGSNQVGDDGPTGTDDGGPTGIPGDGGDAGVDAAPPPVHGKLILVHASSYAPSLRFCFGLSPASASLEAGPSEIAKTVPAPNTVLGLPPGTGGAASDTASDLQNENITIYAIASAAIAADVGDAGTVDCSQLVGLAANAPDAGGLTEGAEYWNIGTLPAGTLTDGTTTLALVTGCVPGLTNSSDQILCPTDYSAATGDLSLTYTKLDTTTAVDGGALGAQFAFGSYPFQQEARLIGGSGAAAAGFYINSLVPSDAGTPVSDAGTDGGDAAAVEDDAGPVLVPVTTFIPIAAPVSYGEIAPASLALVPGLTFTGVGASGFVVTAFGADGGASPVSVPMPFPSIQAISAPALTTPEFANGAGYIFVLVGDPNPALPTFIGADGGATTPDGGVFNTQTAHILGFPVNPPFGN
jgi:hypothetical protein